MTFGESLSASPYRVRKKFPVQHGMMPHQSEAKANSWTTTAKLRLLVLNTMTGDSKRRDSEDVKMVPLGGGGGSKVGPVQGGPVRDGPVNEDE